MPPALLALFACLWAVEMVVGCVLQSGWRQLRDSIEPGSDSLNVLFFLVSLFLRGCVSHSHGIRLPHMADGGSFMQYGQGLLDLGQGCLIYIARSGAEKRWATDSHIVGI